MVIKPIKKSQKLTLRQMKELEEASDLAQAQALNTDTVEDIEPSHQPKKLTLRQMKQIEEAEDLAQSIKTDRVDIFKPVIEDEPVVTPQPAEPNYIPWRDDPPVQSVGKSGWQISDIWRDIRVDDFCS